MRSCSARRSRTVAAEPQMNCPPSMSRRSCGRRRSAPGFGFQHGLRPRPGSGSPAAAPSRASCARTCSRTPRCAAWPARAPTRRSRRRRPAPSSRAARASRCSRPVLRLLAIHVEEFLDRRDRAVGLQVGVLALGGRGPHDRLAAALRRNPDRRVRLLVRARPRVHVRKVVVLAAPVKRTGLGPRAHDEVVRFAKSARAKRPGSRSRSGIRRRCRARSRRSGVRR